MGTSTLRAAWLSLLIVAALWLPPRSAAAQAPTRLRVAVVLDVSLSMKQFDPDKLAALSARLVADLADERDHVTLMTFGTKARTLAAVAGNAPGLQTALDGVGPTDKCTDYAAGLAQAANAFSPTAPAGERRVVVFLTDGEYQPPDEDGDTCDDSTRFDKTRMTDAERQRLTKRVLDAAGTLAARKAKVFVVGLGKGIGAAERSRALLDQVARRTSGRLILVDDADRVPELFTDVFAALVGSPVQKPRPNAAVTLDVPADADGMHVIVRTDRSDVALSLTRGAETFPFGKAAAEARGPSTRLEQGKRPRGYAVYWLGKPPAGPMQVRRTSGNEPLNVWAIYDVGTALRFEGVPEGLAESEAIRGQIRLVSRRGNPVRREPSYLDKVRFKVTLEGRTVELPANGKDVQSFDFGTLSPRDQAYLLSGEASHAEGFLEVDRVERALRVIHRLPVVLEAAPVKFDTMAEEGWVAETRVTLRAPAKVPVALTFTLSVSDEAARRDLRFEPTTVTFGPDTREATIRVQFADPKALRWEDRRYGGELVFTADETTAPLLASGARFTTPIDGTLRSWTLGRWLREHRVALAIAFGLLLLFVWLLGRLLAAKFPPKARIHYVELDSPFPNDTLIKRHARRGAYRSARFRFPLGKKARPLVSFVAKGTAFEVVPEAGASLVRLAPEGEEPRRAAFLGRWDERYRLGDRFEVWLTRT